MGLGEGGEMAPGAIHDPTAGLRQPRHQGLGGTRAIATLKTWKTPDPAVPATHDDGAHG